MCPALVTLPLNRVPFPDQPITVTLPLNRVPFPDQPITAVLLQVLATSGCKSENCVIQSNSTKIWILLSDWLTRLLLLCFLIGSQGCRCCAFWLAHKVATVVTKSCKSLEKYSTLVILSTELSPVPRPKAYHILRVLSHAELTSIPRSPCYMDLNARCYSLPLLDREDSTRGAVHHGGLTLARYGRRSCDL